MASVFDRLYDRRQRTWGDNRNDQGVTRNSHDWWLNRHQQTPTPAPAPAPAPAPTPTSAPDTGGYNPIDPAFRNFVNSNDYQWRLQQGMNALNAYYAGAGLTQSGAAQKAAIDYGQNFASNELQNYMAYLGNQQGLGFSAASAQGGVSQNYANNISNLNNNYASGMSALNSNFANNAGNLYGGYAQGVTSALGNLANAQGTAATNIGSAYGNQAMLGAYNSNGLVSALGAAGGQIAGALSYRPYGSAYSAIAPDVQANIAANPGIF